VPASVFAKYLAGESKKVFVAALSDEQKQGRAYRGTPPSSRVRVGANHLTATVPWVQLVDCALQSSADPYTEYDVAKGKPIPQPRRKVPPPYAKLIKIFLIDGKWTITSFATDSSSTCTP
jgi:hypothetical protein